MSARIRLFGFLIGTALTAAIIIQSGPARLLASIRAAGWVVLPLVALWGVVYLCNARAWQLLTRGGGSSLPFGRAWLITVVAFAINYGTPFVGLGGEPIKIAAAAPWLGPDRAAGTAVGYRLLHALSQVLVFIATLVPAAILLPHTWAMAAGIGVTAVCLAAIAWFLLARHRAGLLEAGVDGLLRLPFTRRFRNHLERWQPRLRELDHEITAIHREDPARFRHALGIETAGRVLSTLEFAVILVGLGRPGNVWQALVIANFSSLVINLLFFLPFELGAKEGGVYVMFQWLGLDPALGAAAALLSRVRELVWMGLGIAGLLLLRRRAPGQGPDAECRIR
ncbi:MAG: flippase-like domain-containing protein [Gemmatimonadota bacterium]